MINSPLLTISSFLVIDLKRFKRFPVECNVVKNDRQLIEIGRGSIVGQHKAEIGISEVARWAKEILLL